MRLTILATLISFLFSTTAYATAFLPMASEQIISVVDLYTDSDDVIAWRVAWEDEHRHGIDVDVLATHGHHNDVLSFGCDVHGDHLHCHHHGHGDHEANKDVSDKSSFEELREVEAIVVGRVERQFARLGGWDAVKMYTMWMEEDDDHHHDDDHGHKDHHGESKDYWAKFVLDVEGQEREVFFLCHRHSSANPFSCHLSNDGHGEPDFDGGHDH